MDILAQFAHFLLSQKNPASDATVKNYLADIRKFIGWFELEFQRTFSPEFLTSQVIEHYKAKTAIAPRSLERSLSTLRKFSSFLISETLLSEDPFAVIKAIAEKTEADPWRLQGFKNYLFNAKCSHLTIKNYIIDVRQFLSWLESVVDTTKHWEVKSSTVGFAAITPAVIEEYKNRLLFMHELSPVSINRKLSSLRRYCSFAASAGYLKSLPQVSSVHELSTNAQSTAKVEAKRLALLPELQAASLALAGEEAIAPETAKRSYSRFPPLRLIQKVMLAGNIIFDALLIGPLAKVTAETQLLVWTAQGGKLFTHVTPSVKYAAKLVKKKIRDPFLPVKNIKKEFYAPLAISLANLPFHKRLLHHVRYARPEWYKSYHKYPLAHYFHFAVLMLVMGAMGIALYRGFITEPSRGNFAIAAFTPLRILSFQGRLTDASDNPITSTRQLRFIIYNSLTASSSARLWEEVRPVTPDSHGIFSTLLASNGSGRNAGLCNSGNPPTSPASGACGIPQSLLRDNAGLWLGISVGTDAELSPRQQLATVSYATNADVLQGLLPTTDADVTANTNVVLALNSSGSVVIPGSALTTFQASNGNLKLTAQTLILTTNAGSGGNLILDPDGLGMVDIRRGLVNNTITNAITTAAGAVEVDDLFAILATSSGQSAFTIDQNGAGPIISASASGTAKFTVDNNGSGTFADDLAVNGDMITSSQTTFSLLNSTISTLSFAQAATAMTIGATSGTITVRNPTLTVGGGSATTLQTSDASLTFNTGTANLLQIASDDDFIPSATSGTNDLGSSSIPWDNVYTNAYFAGSTAGQTISSATCVTTTSGIVTGTGSCAGSGASNWTVQNATIHPNNASSLDLLLGATSTASAKIAFINISGTGSGAAGNPAPSASISGNLSLSAPTTAGTNTLDLLNGSNLNIRSSVGGGAGATSRLFVNGNTGNIGIGTTAPVFKLHVSDSQSASAAAMIHNTAANQTAGHTGLIVKLGADGSATDTNANDAFIKFLRGDAVRKGQIIGATAGVIYETGQADFAEYFKKEHADEQIDYGEIVCIGPHGGVERCSKNSSKIVGAVSDWAAFVGKSNHASDPSYVIVGLVGQLRIKVSSENGSLPAGTYLSVSSNPGIAAKAVKPGMSIGRTLEAFDKANPGEGKVLVAIQPGYHDPDVYLTDAGNLNISQKLGTEYEVKKDGETIDRIGAFKETVSGKIQAGVVNAVQVSAGSITIAGTSLRDYIEAIVHEVAATIGNVQTANADNFVSPILEADRVKTNIVSPLSGDTVSVDGNLSVGKPENTSEDVALQVSGSASVSGKLATKSLATDEASVSGTLRAKKIIADEIEGLEARLATIAATTVINTVNIYQNTQNTQGASESGNQNVRPSETLTSPIASDSSEFSEFSGKVDSTQLPDGASLLSPLFQTEYTELASISGQLAYVPNLRADFARLDSLTARLATFQQGLMSFGPASFADVSVAGQLSVNGNFILSDNSINVLGADLELQPLRQGNVSFMSGLIIIDTEGNLKVSGNAYFAKDVAIGGKLTAKLISPIPDEDLIIRLPSLIASECNQSGNPGDCFVAGAPRNDKGGKFVIQNASGSGVLAINDLGDMIASGSGRFSNLIADSITVVRGVQADTSLTQTVASGSAGRAIISRNQLERTVFSPFVKADSLIYITPTSNTNGVTPYVARQTAEGSTDTFGQVQKGSFTIQVPTRATSDININWWIVN